MHEDAAGARVQQCKQHVDAEQAAAEIQLCRTQTSSFASASRRYMPRQVPVLRRAAACSASNMSSDAALSRRSAKSLRLGRRPAPRPI